MGLSRDLNWVNGSQGLHPSSRFLPTPTTTSGAFSGDVNNSPASMGYQFRKGKVRTSWWAGLRWLVAAAGLWETGARTLIAAAALGGDFPTARGFGVDGQSPGVEGAEKDFTATWRNLLSPVDRQQDDVEVETETSLLRRGSDFFLLPPKCTGVLWLLLIRVAAAFISSFTAATPRMGGLLAAPTSSGGGSDNFLARISGAVASNAAASLLPLMLFSLVQFSSVLARQRTACSGSTSMDFSRL